MARERRAEPTPEVRAEIEGHLARVVDLVYDNFDHPYPVDGVYSTSVHVAGGSTFSVRIEGRL